MQTYKRIYAAILLAIFSMVTFHDLAPHVHHEHEYAGAHDLHHEDHHNEECSSILGVMGHFLHLHEHSHNDCEIDVCPEIPALKQQNRKDYGHFYAIVTDTDHSRAYIRASFMKPDHGQGFAHHLDALLNSISFRGPPAALYC
jgi:hypothetical protein